MSEKVDRRIRNIAPALVAVIVLIIALAGAGGFYWFRVYAPKPVQPVAVRNTAAALPASRQDEPLVITLVYPVGGSLMSGTAGVRRQPELQSQAREVVAALLADRRASQTAVLKDVRLRAFYVDPSGAAYIDLAPVKPQQHEINASAWEELLAVYAFVNTLALNFEEIEQVRILIDGKEARTLAGHIDLSRAYAKRMDLVKQ